VLEEKAEDLGRVLGQTDEYKALRRATEALREDQANDWRRRSNEWPSRARNR
jgi:cell fate (sporulation/competence/biofilm development) regulator YlbF (YheA/YmcA/DUF963 family)